MFSRSLIGIPLVLALASTSLGCAEEIPQARQKDKAHAETAAKPSAEPDNGPAPNAPKGNPDLKDPLVEDAQTGRYGDTLFLPAYDDPKTFNPTMVQDATSARFLAYTFDSLVDEDGITFEVKPALAKSWTLEKDNKTYVFKLRRGVKWHDGKPFTADDVVFTWMTVLPNAGIPWASRDDLKIDGKLPIVTKLDDYTVKIQLPKPFAPFLRSMGIAILPKHIFAPWVATKGADGNPISNSKWGVDAKITEIVGTGPFMFESYSPGERIVLKRNPNYYRQNRHHQPLPYLDRLSIPFLKTLDTAILKFKSGETDSQWMPGKDYAYMKPLEREGNFKIYNAGPDFRTSFISFNLNPNLGKDGKPLVEPYKLKWFADKRFRQAVSYAINRKALIKAVYRGLAASQDSAIFQKSPFFDASVPHITQDLDKARALLKEAGFKLDGDKLVDASGHPVVFTLLMDAGSKEGELQANMIKENLAQLGMRMNLQQVTFNVKIQRTHESKDWEAELGAWGASVEPHGVASLWKSNGVYHFFNLNPSETETQRYTYAWEKRIDELYNQGAVTVDPKKRQAIYNEFQHIVAEEQPLIFLPVFFYTAAIRNTVGNVNPSAYSTLGSSWNVYELYKKAPQGH